MTVCVAALCRWNYGTAAEGDTRHAVIVMTDRMITAGDVQYEPPQTKHAHITPTIMLVIAGDYSLHSQAIKKTVQRFETSSSATPEQVAAFYGRAIQSIKLKEAEDIFLAPLGLNSDSFLAQQKDMAPHFVSLLTDQMQAYRGEETDALIIGASDGVVDIYGVDAKGMVACRNDVGFAAIGSGSWHVKSRLMSVGYSNSSSFAAALSFVYAAKKAAEVAPGVGRNTDILLVFKNGYEKLRPDVANKLHELYAEYAPKAYALGTEYIEKVQDYISKPIVQDSDEQPKGLPGGNAQTNERDTPPAAETPQRNEAGKT